MAAQHLLSTSPGDPKTQPLSQPMASTLAWASRAGVLLDPQPLFGSNLARYDTLREANQQAMPGNHPRNGEVEPIEGIETDSNPSIDSFLPLPGVREISSTLVPVHQDVGITTGMSGVSQLDSSFDQLEHHQAKEQSRPLDRFKLLKQWQQQQQEKLLRQQQEQLEMLKSEQYRVHQALLEQRQQQWGAGRIVKSPPRSPHQHRPVNQMGSSIPDAIAKGTLSLSQTAGPMVLGTLLNDHRQTHQVQVEDLDTASETNSSVVEEGVYPLPDTASEISDGYYSPSRRKEIEDRDTGMEADMEEDGSMDQNTDEFTPEEGPTPLKSSEDANQPPPQLHHQQATVPADYDRSEDGGDEEEMMGDDRRIQGGATKTFEELLEEQLKLEAEKQQNVKAVAQQSPPAASPGRKFLRRGQGTARFGKITIKPPKKKSPPKKAEEKRTSNESPPRVGEEKTISSKMTSGGEKGTTVGNRRKGVEEGRAGVKPMKKSQSKLSPQPFSRKVAVIRESMSISQPAIPGTRLKSYKPLSRSVIDKEKLPSPISMATVSKQQTNQDLPTEGAHPDDTIEMSFQIRMHEWQKKAEDEEEDLEEFELLEQAADDNTSFSSNASLVVNMMKRVTAKRQVLLRSLSEKSNSLQSSQEQPAMSQDQSHDHSSASSSDSDNSNLDGTLTGDNLMKPPAPGDGRQLQLQQFAKVGSSTEDDSEPALDRVNPKANHDLQFRTKQSEDERTNTKQNLNVNNSGSNLDDPRVRGILQDESEDSGDDDLGSDSEDDVNTDEGSQSNLAKEQIEDDDDDEDVHGNDEEEVTHKSGLVATEAAAAGTSSHALNVDFDDEESWGDLGTAVSGDEESDESILIGAPIITSTPPVAGRNRGFNSHQLDRRKADVLEDHQQIESPPTSKLVSKLFPKLKPVVPKQQQQQEKRQEETLQKTSERPVGGGVQSKLLRDKLAELENEIERFRKENAMLAKLREEREKGLSSLQAEISEFHKQKTEELQKLQEFKDEEMRKLRREKKNFEKYQKAMRAMPDKKDRTEMELLKNQLSDLQEELNKRESRWQANSARLKTRVDVLEKDNKELEEELEKLLEEKKDQLQKEQKKAKSNAAKSRARQLAELESARLASYPALPRVNVSSSTSSDEDEEETMKRTNRVHDDSDLLETSNQAELSKSPGNPRDEEQRVGKKDVKMKSPPRPSRLTSTEPQHARKQDPEVDPASQPRIQRKRSVHFNTGSPKHTKPLPVQTSNQSSPPASSWNLDHPALSQEASSPGRRKMLHDDDENQMNGRMDAEEEEIHHPDGKVEHIAADGSRVITFNNGTRKEISPDGEAIKVTFFNGDMKQIMPDKRVVYYYSETGTTHTTYPDGLEILQFPNNQTEKHYPDGTKEITFPDHTIKYLFANGNEESVFADGTVLRVDKNGEKTMEFPNGQREVHTKQYKKREYPDGSVKTVYSDGRQETRYANGRIRVKDKDGAIILDKTC